MKFYNQFLKYKLHSNTEDGGGGGGGTDDGGEGGENNSDNDLIDHSTMWDNDVIEEQPAVNQQQQQQAAPVSAAQAFSNHVDGIDFGADPAAMMEAVRGGDVEAFSEQLKNMQVGIYKAGMLDANKMMQQTSGNLKTELQNNTETTISSNKIISQMHKDLPYTAEPAYAPMAKAVLSKLLSKKGMTTEKAIKETGDYFSQMANKVGGNMNGNLNNANQNNNNQFGNNSQDEEMDWVSFMGGKPE